jgi:hypothetical protein
MFENNILCGNQQPSSKEKVQRLGSDAVASSGAKWGGSEQVMLKSVI